MDQEMTIEQRRARYAAAETKARALLKPGDRIRVAKCPGTKRTITFAGWDGHWIVSKSGIKDYPVTTVDRVNGEPVSFTD